jgi:hypothetical protein
MLKARVYSATLAGAAVAAQKEDRHSAILAWRRWKEASAAARQAERLRDELLECLEAARRGRDMELHAALLDELASL